MFNVKFYLPVFYEAHYTRYAHGSKNNKICIDRWNNSIHRTGENIIYDLNRQNENKTSLDYWQISITTCTFWSVPAFRYQVCQCPVSRKSVEDVHRCPNVDPTIIYTVFKHLIYDGPGNAWNLNVYYLKFLSGFYNIVRTRMGGLSR